MLIKYIVQDKRISAILLFCFLFFVAIQIVVFNSREPISISTTFAEFSHDKYKYSLLYPDDWRARDFPSGNHGDFEAVAVISAKISCSFGCVRIGDVSPKIDIAYKELENSTLDAVLAWGEDRIQASALDGIYEIESEQEINIDGNVAVTRIYMQKSPLSKELEPAIDTYILRDDDAFIFSLNVDPRYYEKLIPVYNLIVHSFKST